MHCSNLHIAKLQIGLGGNVNKRIFVRCNYNQLMDEIIVAAVY